MSDESAVMEPQAETKERKYTPLTDAQKQAATLRRDAALLTKYGNAEKAKELEAQADALAPVRAHTNKRVDPLQVLSAEEQSWLVNYFSTTKKGFAVIARYISAKKLQEIFQNQGQ